MTRKGVKAAGTHHLILHQLTAQAPMAPTALEDDDTEDGEHAPLCVLSVNASDPSGAGGLSADILALSALGVHALPVCSGAYVRDSARIEDFYPLDADGLAEQLRAVCEDLQPDAFKLGFAGSPEQLGAVVGLTQDYTDAPLVAYMPDLSWWSRADIEAYQDAFADLVLPHCAVLVGHYTALWHWLLPDWHKARAPTPRDLAMAAGTHGADLTLVMGLSHDAAQIDLHVCSPHQVLAHTHTAVPARAALGLGDSLSAGVAARLIQTGDAVQTLNDCAAALSTCLHRAYRPGMGLWLPDHLGWNQVLTDPAPDPEPTRPALH
ncbi:MAG: hypothetical protein Fur007_00030 [Rhodoferax sp.]